MKRKVYVGKTMNAIFNTLNNGKKIKYVQPCKVLDIDENGFWAECHNGGEKGNGKGKEFFENDSIGKGVFFSKDTAEIKIKEK